MKLEKFIWDHGNTEHIARHNMTPDEVEEVFEQNYVLLRTRNKRYLALGQSCFGRYITVVFEYNSKHKSILVITARHMDYKEKNIIERNKGYETQKNTGF